MVICCNVKMDLDEIGCEGMDWIQPAQDKSLVAQDSVSTVMNSLFEFPKGRETS
jgi:hypothetical protein